MKVLKFGGSSVGNSQSIEKVVSIIKSSIEVGESIVVLSAMQGTTDALVEIGKSAESGDASFREQIDEIEERHMQTIETLIPISKRDSIAQFVGSYISQLRKISEGVFLLRELSPRTLDSIQGLGELLSSKIVSSKLSALGIDHIWKDSRELITTDSNFGYASVDFEKTNEQISDFIASEPSSLYIFPGFIAANPNGTTTTLGRGGSDYTGSIVAAAIDADVLEIWTDVNGMMTADPRIVQNIHEISRITYREALELSHFGAKIIYPLTVVPIQNKGIPLWIKNTFDPDAYGTLIASEESAPTGVIRGISSIGNIAVINLEGSGMIGIPGYSKRLFDALSRSKINVILITQSSSEHSICVAIEDIHGEVARESVNKEFEFEINRGMIEPLRVESGFSILAVIGDNMRHQTGVAGRMFSTLGHNGINITAIAQGSSERNISAIIRTNDVRKAVNTLHEEFFSDGLKQINLFIVGVGTVGSRLLEQLHNQKEYVAEKARLSLRVVGLANSRKQVVELGEINLLNWREALERGDERSDFTSLIIKRNLRNSIFVDVTAEPSIVDDYERLLDRSISIVACNKVAASSNFTKYQELKDLARKRNANFNFETNVGAGLPIINTITDLMRSGDRINRIDAVLSGTLNFVFNNYDGSNSFSSVVRLAMEAGFTEPDPRLDLSGADVARKILILARESGYNLEMEDVEIRTFLPESCLLGDVEHFFRDMESKETYFQALLSSATNQGLKLKYIASFKDGKASVGLEEIDATHNFANLSGKDNAVLFYTNRYSDQPLVVKGAGAGADVTAAGVFADIIRAARI